MFHVQKSKGYFFLRRDAEKLLTRLEGINSATAKNVLKRVSERKSWQLPGYGEVVINPIMKEYYSLRTEREIAGEGFSPIVTTFQFKQKFNVFTYGKPIILLDLQTIIVAIQHVFSIQLEKHILGQQLINFYKGKGRNRCIYALSDKLVLCLLLGEMSGLEGYSFSYEKGCILAPYNHVFKNLPALVMTIVSQHAPYLIGEELREATAYAEKFNTFIAEDW